MFMRLVLKVAWRSYDWIGVTHQSERFLMVSNTRSQRNKNVDLSYLFMCSLRISERHDDDFDMLSTPSSFHCCLSQDSITCICLSPLLSSVLLEWCSSVLPPNLVKRELASYTDSLFRFS